VVQFHPRAERSSHPSPVFSRETFHAALAQLVEQQSKNTQPGFSRRKAQ
jgi:hypothetical protein